MKHLEILAGGEKPPTRDLPSGKSFSNANLQPAEVKVHPSGSGGENASIFFVGTATTILYDVPGVLTFRQSLTRTIDREWEGIRLMTDVNALLRIDEAVWTS
jgi:hypothetical protein